MFNGKMLRIVSKNLTDAIDIAAEDYGKEIKKYLIEHGKNALPEEHARKLYNVFVDNTSMYFTGGTRNFFLLRGGMMYRRFEEASQNPNIAFDGLGNASARTPNILYAIAYYAITGRRANARDCMQYTLYAKNRMHETLLRIDDELEW